MASERQLIKLGQIYLDLVNPRHEPKEAEKEAMAHLLAHEGVKPLAKSIAQMGLSPLHTLAVAPHPTAKGFFIPAEGNRRVCALKLLEDPERAPTEADKRYFRGLKATMVRPITELEVMQFPSKDAARNWVSLQHEGEQGGVGTKKWGADEKARFNMEGSSPTNPNAQALLLLGYAVKKSLVTAEQRAKIGVTTVQRYLSNPVFRDTIGLQNRNDLTITVAQNEFDHVLKRFLNDLVDPHSDAGSRTKAEDRKAYAAGLRKDGDAPTSRNHPPQQADTEEPPRPKAAEKGKDKASSTRNSASRDTDKTVIPSSFKASIPRDTTLKRLYDELRTLDAGEFPFSATYLLRAVIEQGATSYLKLRAKGRAIPKELHQKIEALEKQLASEGVDDSLRKFLRVMSSNKDSSASPDTLGHFVHGGAIPTKNSAFVLWDNIAPAMSHILNNLK